MKVEVLFGVVPTFGSEGDSKRCLSLPSGAAADGDEDEAKDATKPMGLIGEFSEGFWLWFWKLALKPGALSALAGSDAWGPAGEALTPGKPLTILRFSVA